MSDTQENSTQMDTNCPQCGGKLEFVPQHKSLRCESCGFEKAVEMERASENNDNQRHRRPHGDLEQNFYEIDDMVTEANWGTETNDVECQSCGASIVFSANDMSNECPYCGAALSANTGKKQNPNTISPTGVIVFNVDAEKAKEKFTNWIKGKFFCPSEVKQYLKPEKMQGIYVPYWTFDASVSTKYSGEYGVRTGTANDKQRIDWYLTDGFIDADFDDVLVPGTNKQNRVLLRGIEPFNNTNNPIRYEPHYLAGFGAESYTIGPKEAWTEAETIMKAQLLDKISNKIIERNNACDTRNIKVEPSFEDITYKYLLMPVWISSFKYQDKVYNFMVNGQTGKVFGDYPISKTKVTITLLIIAAVLFALYKFVFTK